MQKCNHCGYSSKESTGPFCPGCGSEYGTVRVFHDHGGRGWIFGLAAFIALLALILIIVFCLVPKVYHVDVYHWFMNTLNIECELKKPCHKVEKPCNEVVQEKQQAGVVYAAERPPQREQQPQPQPQPQPSPCVTNPSPGGPGTTDGNPGSVPSWESPTDSQTQTPATPETTTGDIGE